MTVFFSFTFASGLLFDTQGQALEGVLAVATQIRPSLTSLDTLDQINDYFLDNWCYTSQPRLFYPPGKERRDFKVKEAISPEQKSLLFENFKALGMIDACVPSLKKTKKVFVVALGGYYGGIIQRYEQARHYFTSIRDQFDNVKMLLVTSDRILDPDLDEGSPAELKSEEDLGKYIASKDEDAVILSGPSTHKHVSAIDRAFILKNWFKAQEKMEDTAIVLVARQPLTQYVLATFDKAFQDMPHKFEVLSGPSSESEDTAVYMDAIARTLSILSTIKTL